jgi:hypothetical protein
MALVTCRECGSSVSDQAQACPKCGGPSSRFTAPPPKIPGPTRLDRALIWGAGSFGALVFLGWLAPKPTPEENAASQAQFKAKQVIDTCWELQTRKSFSPDTQRFVAGTCEMAEEDYRVKYGRYYKKDGQTP